MAVSATSLKGGLGGLLAGGAAGSVISGGLGDLLKQLQQSGHGDTANSWVGHGPNKPISPGDLAKALGADQIDGADVANAACRATNCCRASASNCPRSINHLTPDGRLPTENEVSGRL